MQELCENIFKKTFAQLDYYVLLCCMGIPERLKRPRGAKPEYDFATLEVGQDKGKHVLCRVNDRDRKWNSIRTLCNKYTRESKGAKVFKSYPTETGVFYWREK